MRRRIVHALFGAAAAVFAALAVQRYAEIGGLERVELAVERAAASAGRTSDDAAGTGAADTDAASGGTRDGTGRGSEAARNAPRARLARALALSATRDLEAAEPLLAALALEYPDAAVGRDARFALANAYLREGLRPEADPARARAWLELAKQRYREALRLAPDDHDARYNLERALRLAPEGDDVRLVEVEDPTKSVDVIFPDFAPTDLP